MFLHHSFLNVCSGMLIMQSGYCFLRYVYRDGLSTLSHYIKAAEIAVCVCVRLRLVQNEFSSPHRANKPAGLITTRMVISYY